jgi:hypothetical protein
VAQQLPVQELKDEFHLIRKRHDALTPWLGQSPVPPRAEPLHRGRHEPDLATDASRDVLGRYEHCQDDDLMERGALSRAPSSTSNNDPVFS